MTNPFIYEKITDLFMHNPLGYKIGQMSALASVLSFVVVAIAIIIGVRVFSDVEGTINLAPGTANTTATNVIDQTYSAFELSAVILIVLIASVILSVLIGFGRV